MHLHWSSPRVIILLSCTLIAALPGNFVFAQSKVNSKELDEIRSLALSVPPEVGADALLELLGANLIHSREDRLEIANEAARLAEQAHFPYKKRLRFGKSDTRSANMRGVYMLNIDTESLRLRAIQYILLDSPPLARELFGQLTRYKGGRHDCRSRLVYDPELYYTTLLVIANRGFTKEDLRRERNVDLIVLELQSLSSPAQVVPALKALRSIEGLTASQLRRVATALEDALLNIQPDDRAFQDGYELIEAASAFARVYQSYGVPLDGLIGSIRTYIIRQLSLPPRCADSIARMLQHKEGDGKLPPVVVKFNSWTLRSVPVVSKELPQIRESDTAISTVGPPIEDKDYWQTPTAKGIQYDVRRQLMYDKDDKPLSLEQRSTGEWLKRAQALIARIRNWSQETGDSFSDYFHQKCDMYEIIISLLPTGPERALLLDDYSVFLGTTRMQRDNPTEWYFRFRSLFGQLRAQNELDRTREQFKSPGDDVAAAFRRIGNPAFSLYLRLETLKALRGGPA